MGPTLLVCDISNVWCYHVEYNVQRYTRGQALDAVRTTLEKMHVKGGEYRLLADNKCGKNIVSVFTLSFGGLAGAIQSQEGMNLIDNKHLSAYEKKDIIGFIMAILHGNETHGSRLILGRCVYPMELERKSGTASVLRGWKYKLVQVEKTCVTFTAVPATKVVSMDSLQVVLERTLPSPEVRYENEYLNLFIDKMRAAIRGAAVFTRKHSFPLIVKDAEIPYSDAEARNLAHSMATCLTANSENIKLNLCELYPLEPMACGIDEETLEREQLSFKLGGWGEIEAKVGEMLGHHTSTCFNFRAVDLTYTLVTLPRIIHGAGECRINDNFEVEAEDNEFRFYSNKLVLNRPICIGPGNALQALFNLDSTTKLSVVSWLKHIGVSLDLNLTSCVNTDTEHLMQYVSMLKQVEEGPYFLLQDKEDSVPLDALMLENDVLVSMVDKGDTFQTASKIACLCGGIPFKAVCSTDCGEFPRSSIIIALVSSSTWRDSLTCVSSLDDTFCTYHSQYILSETYMEIQRTGIDMIREALASCHLDTRNVILLTFGKQNALSPSKEDIESIIGKSKTLYWMDVKENLFNSVSMKKQLLLSVIGQDKTTISLMETGTMTSCNCTCYRTEKLCDERARELGIFLGQISFNYFSDYRDFTKPPALISAIQLSEIVSESVFMHRELKCIGDLPFHSNAAESPLKLTHKEEYPVPFALPIDVILEYKRRQNT